MRQNGLNSFEKHASTGNRPPLRPYHSRAVMCLILAVIATLWGATASAQVVHFPDPNLEAVIREAINKPSGDIMASDLSSLTSLDAIQRGISSLEGLEFCTQLETLWLAANDISELTPLSGLTAIYELDLSSNQISDLTPLSGLTALTGLHLYQNQISDLTPLSILTELTILELYANHITDLTPLSGLTALTWLKLDINQISDLTPLSKLTSLTFLSLWSNQISDLTPLSTCTSLTSLHLDENQISDLTPLSEIVSLTDLGLWNNQISDLTPLSGLTAVTRLGLYNNQISDLTPLSGLTALSWLFLSHNQISELTPLSELTSLNELLLHDNQISDLTPLSGLIALYKLNLSDNQISDLTPLSGLTALYWLYLSGNQISELTPLFNLTNIDFLELNDNPIRFYLPLNSLRPSGHLYLPGAPQDLAHLWGPMIPEGQNIFFDYNENGFLDVYEDFYDRGISDVFIDLDFNGVAEAFESRCGWPYFGPDGFRDLDQDGTSDFFEDNDDDGIPDAYEDRNHDGQPDALIRGVASPWSDLLYADFDGDGIWNAADLTMIFGDFNENDMADIFEIYQGIAPYDVWEILGDYDNDGRVEAFLDSNNNGKPDVFEDRDHNGTPDVFEDNDSDGVPDLLVTLPGQDRPIAFMDADGNGRPDIGDDASFSSRLLRYSAAESGTALLGTASGVFRPSMRWVSGTLDLGLRADGTAASSSYWFGSTVPERLPAPFAPAPGVPNPMWLFAGAQGPARVDATGEPGGFVMGSPDGRVQFFNTRQYAIDGAVTVQEYAEYLYQDYAGLTDVAGLAQGRAALLATRNGEDAADVLVLARPLRASGVGYMPCLAEPAAVLSLPPSERAIAVAGFQSGGLAVLTDSRVITVDAGYPEDPEQWKSFPLSDAADLLPEAYLTPLDIAVDTKDTVLVLTRAQWKYTNDGKMYFPADNVPVAIYPFSPLQRNCNISVPVTDYVSRVKVQVDLEHTNVSDLVLKLRSPQGTEIRLFEHGGNPGSGDNFTGTVFDDLATESIQTSAPPFTGTFRPLEPLSVFSGENGHGTWTLSVSDTGGFSLNKTGQITGVLLTIDYGGFPSIDGDQFVMALRDFGAASRWTPVDVAMPLPVEGTGENVSGNGSVAIATFMTPDPLEPVQENPQPYEPQLPEPAPGESREPVGDSGVTVDTQPGNEVHDGFTWAGPGWASVLNFLRINVDGPNELGRFLKWNASEIRGRGELLFRFDSLPGFPSAGFPLLDGDFHIDLATGQLHKDSGSWNIDLGILGQINFEKIRLLGLGQEYGRSTPQSGIVIEGGQSETGLGGLGFLKFDRLFLGDFGGQFKMTFGMPGLPGLMPPYNEGALSFADTDFIGLKTTGEDISQDAISFDSVVLRLGPNASPLFRLTLDGLKITLDDITFQRSFTELAGVMDLVITEGGVGFSGSGAGWKPHPGAGVYAKSVTVRLRSSGQEISNVENLYIGEGGVSFDNDVRFQLAGFTAWLKNLRFQAPFDENGRFQMLRAEFAVAGLKAWLTGVEIPLNGSMPTATGGSIALGDPENDGLRLELSGNLAFSSNEISIPRIVLMWPGYSREFPGGRITRSSIEIFDAPAMDIMGVLVDLETAYFGGAGFATSRAYVGFGDMSVTLRDLGIGANGLRIGGGGFEAFGFGVDVSSSQPSNAPADAWCLDATVSGIPMFGQAGMGFCVQGSDIQITGVWLPNIVFGPVRVKNGRLEQQEDRLYGSAQVGFAALPDMDGYVILRDSKLEELGLGLVFTREAGYPFGGFLLVALPNGTPLLLLNSIHGTVRTSELTVQANASLCLFTTVPIPFMGERALAGANGSVVVSGQGYMRADADVLIFPAMNQETGAWQGGYAVGGGTVIAGRVYRNGSFFGTGLWGQGYLDFFGFITARAENWAYLSGDVGGILDGTLKVPRGVPIIGGESFAGMRMAHRTNLLRREGSFCGDVWFKICSPPIYYPCGVEWCGDCVGPRWARFCFNYPCGVKWCSYRYCPKFRFGVTIDDSGLHTKRDEKGFLRFDKGYSTGSGVTVLTNYRLLAEKYALEAGVPSQDPDAKDTVVIPFTLGAKEERILGGGIRETVFRYETAYQGHDTHISLRFPDGRTFTRYNVPALGTTDVPKAPDVGDMLIMYRHSRFEDPETGAQRQEAAFVCKGPYGFDTLDVLDENGVPTGEREEIFGPGPLPAGSYQILVEGGKGAEGKLDVLGANQQPELVYSRVEPLDENVPYSYRVSWRAKDANGDEIIARVHLATDPDNPENSIVVGKADGYVSTSGQGTCSFNLTDPAIADLHLSGTLYIVLSLEDRQSKEDTPDNRQFFVLGTVETPPPPDSPPKVEGVVAVASDGSAEVYWEPVKWADKADNVQLVAYAVTAEELGPEGTTAPPITIVVPAVHVTQEVDEFDNPVGDPVVSVPDQETLLPGLTNGRKYRLTITPIAHETGISKDGQPMVMENPGEPSDAFLIEPYGQWDNAPRFLSQAPPVARLDNPYRYVIRLEDLDGDPVDLRLAGMVPIVGEEQTPAKAEVVFPDLYLGPTGNPYEWELTLTPMLAKASEIVGQWTVTLEAQDHPKGNIARQEFVLSVAQHDNTPLRAAIVSIPSLTVYVGETFTYRVEVTGLPEDYPTAFSLLDAPANMQIDSGSGLVTWSPGAGDIGPHRVTVGVGERSPEQDVAAGCPTCSPSRSGMVVEQVFTLTVLADPAARYLPVLSVVPGTTPIGPEGGLVTLQVSNIGTGTVDWTAIAGSSWFTVANVDKGTGLVQVAVSANSAQDERVGSVYIVPVEDGVLAVEASIVQAASSAVGVLVFPLYVSVPLEGGEHAVGVWCLDAGACNWYATVAAGAEWISIVSAPGGPGDGFVTLQCDPNTGAARRVGLLCIEAESGTGMEVWITQPGVSVSGVHNADQDGDNRIALNELLRIIQFFNSGGFHCAESRDATEDGYVPGPGSDYSCLRHASDYSPSGPDWKINLTELLRVIQFFNSGGYYYCPDAGTEDGYCPGLG